VDASGNIYLAGHTAASGGSGAAYIARLSPIARPSTRSLSAAAAPVPAPPLLWISIRPGAVYVAGTTAVSDSPVSAGAAQSSGATALAAKLDAKGNILYSALIGAYSDISVQLPPNIADRVRYPSQLSTEFENWLATCPMARSRTNSIATDRSAPEAGAVYGESHPVDPLPLSDSTCCAQRPEELTVQQVAKRFGTSDQVVY
jgi:hypothetical protein